MKHKGLIALLIVFAVQLAVPAYMILDQKHTLANGQLFKFKTQPIDPYDPFRGRYVTLRIAAADGYFKLADAKQQDLAKGTRAYALLTKDDEGYAKVSKLQLEKPADNSNYIEAELGYRYSKEGYRISLPIDRYYAQEDKAPEIERAIGRRGRRQVDDVYVAVKVLKGKATIEDLYVNQMPVADYLTKQSKLKDKP